jgi:hypothetical protein
MLSFLLSFLESKASEVVIFFQLVPVPEMAEFQTMELLFFITNLGMSLLTVCRSIIIQIDEYFHCMQTRQHWDGRGSRRLECDPLIWR